MTMTLAHTRIAVQFIIEDDSGQVERVLTAASVVLEAAVKVIQLTADVIEAIDFTLKTTGIMFKALAWGLGVTV